MKLLIKSLFLGFFLVVTNVSAQMDGSSTNLKRRLIDIEVKKTGPYFGIQRGKYTVLEIGAARQWKKIRIKQPVIHAAHVGFNYNFKYNMLGYDMGYWYKPNRIGLTYGGNIFFRTNFDNTRLGIAPVLGFRFAILHLQTGYHFMTRLPDNFETNKFFVSLRIGIINDRDFDFNLRKKRKK
ncbi:MAG: hypothetical protein P8H56_13695 [Crocinitomicaceae bacterium]|nr:hypothetical protein [Crocinitomicaceae bacterium]MDG1659627.1 hypothetical protein [Crocinitomicaceae bacterium]